jgi:hypothetical protein
MLCTLIAPAALSFARVIGCVKSRFFCDGYLAPVANVPTDYSIELHRGRKMLKSITLMLAIATLGCFSVAIWAKPIASTTTAKDAQCNQNVCTTKCDAKNEKCSITCEDKAAGNNCERI